MDRSVENERYQKKKMSLIKLSKVKISLLNQFLAQKTKFRYHFESFYCDIYKMSTF